jgi:hypothetical protein
MQKAASDQYWQHAEDAERAAEAAQDHAAKELYREVARRWRETAEEADGSAGRLAGAEAMVQARLRRSTQG